MKKLINNLKEAFLNYQKESKIKQDKKEFELAINGMLKLTFSKDTLEAIKRKEKFNELFDSEIAKRGLNAQIEHLDCEEYFNNKNKSLTYKL